MWINPEEPHMVLRRLVQVKMTIDHTKIYDALQFAEGNALAGSVEIVPVRHGGENENGELRPPPSTNTFALDYLTEHGRIETKAFIPLAVKAGLTRNAAYAQIKKLTDHKAAKRIETGVYVLVERKGRAPAPAPKTKAQGPRKPQSPPGQTMVDSIVR